MRSRKYYTSYKKKYDSILNSLSFKIASWNGKIISRKPYKVSIFCNRSYYYEYKFSAIVGLYMVLFHVIIRIDDKDNERLIVILNYLYKSRIFL